MELMVSKQQLKSHIENLRKELINTGMKQGFDSSKTLHISQQLDTLINKYQKMK